MHIEHTKLTGAKVWQYANQISNTHAQYKLVLEEYIAIEFWQDFLPVYSTNYALSKSNWDHELYNSLLCKLHLILFVTISWISITKKGEGSWSQLDSNEARVFTYFGKEIYQIWLTVLSSRAILRCACAHAGNYHNPNFITFERFRAKVMPKCRIWRWLKKSFPLSIRITILVKDPGLNAPECSKNDCRNPPGRAIYLKFCHNVWA